MGCKPSNLQRHILLRVCKNKCLLGILGKVVRCLVKNMTKVGEFFPPSLFRICLYAAIVIMFATAVTYSACLAIYPVIKSFIRIAFYYDKKINTWITTASNKSQHVRHKSFIYLWLMSSFSDCRLFDRMDRQDW